MSEEKAWLDKELLMLIRIPRESLPELSKLLERPLDDVERKYKRTQKIFRKLNKAKAKKYLKMGYGEDEAFEILSFKEEIDIKRIRDEEESLTRL